MCDDADDELDDEGDLLLDGKEPFGIYDESDCPLCDGCGERTLEGGFYRVRCDCPCHW